MISRVMERMVRYFGGDVRRINHALKVFSFAWIIGSREGLDAVTQEVVACTALLHDIGIPEAERKYGSSAGNYQEIEGPPVARQILEELGIAGPVADRVCFITGNHHSYGKIDGIDFQVIVEADFLVNIFEDGLSREQAETIGARIFRTDAGKALLSAMYLG